VSRSPPGRAPQRPPPDRAAIATGWLPPAAQRLPLVTAVTPAHFAAEMTTSDRHSGQILVTGDAKCREGCKVGTLPFREPVPAGHRSLLRVPCARYDHFPTLAGLISGHLVHKVAGSAQGPAVSRVSAARQLPSTFVPAVTSLSFVCAVTIFRRFAKSDFRPTQQAAWRAAVNACLARVVSAPVPRLGAFCRIRHRRKRPGAAVYRGGSGDQGATARLPGRKPGTRRARWPRRREGPPRQ
jgi:hypothetical protein